MSLEATQAASTKEIPLPRVPARSEQTYQTSQPGPRRSRFRSFLRVLRTTVVVLVLLAAAVAGGTYITRDRLAARAFVELDNAVLTAQPVAVGTPNAGTVTRVLVSAQNQVSAGQTLARVSAIGPDGSQQTQSLKAPAAGIVSAVNVATGGVAAPGQPIITLYDPAQLTFQAKASIEQLHRLRLGMTAKVTAAGLRQPISARLDRVVPQIGNGTAPPGGSQATNGFTVVLVPNPSEVSTVGTLVPGLPFTATVDTKTAVGGTPAINGAR